MKRHALITLPSLSSLKALRRYAASSGASEAFSGFGDPALGDPNDVYPHPGSQRRRQLVREHSREPVKPKTHWKFDSAGFQVIRGYYTLLDYALRARANPRWRPAATPAQFRGT